MCSGPVSVSTELGPTIGATGEVPAAEGATSAGAVKTLRTASGSLSITSFSPLGANVTVNASPRLLAQRSRNQVGATAHATVCRSAGARGPGGRALRGPAAALGGCSAAVSVGAGIVLAIPCTLPPGGARASGRGRAPRRRRAGVGRARCRGLLLRVLCGVIDVVIEHAAHGVLDRVRGVADGVPDPGRERVHEQDRADADGC